MKAPVQAPLSPVPPILRGLLPPLPPDEFRTYRRRDPWLVLVVVAVLVLCCVVSTLVGFWFISERPVTAMGALAGIAPACYLRRSQLRQLQLRAYIGWLLLGGIAGGASAQAASQLAGYLKHGSPASSPSIILSVLGNGAARGVIAVVVVNTVIMTFLAARLVWRNWYVFTRRAA